jgi:hypothetical protein
VIRFASLVALLASCDVAFQLGEQKVPLPTVCGPYTQLTPVTIDPSISEPHDFSVSLDGLHALVSGPAGPVPLVPDGPDSWMIDGALQPGLASYQLLGAHESWRDPAAPPQPGDALGWYNSLSPDGHPYILDRFEFKATSWAPDASVSDLRPDPDYDAVAGNDVETFVGPGDEDIVHHVIELEIALHPPTPNRVTQLFNTLPAHTLQANNQFVTAINTADLLLTGVVLGQTRDRIVMSATHTDGTDEGLYLSHAILISQGGSGDFDDPIPFGGPKVDTPDDETEPWINQDCTKLWFRRISKDHPSDPGTIFVAE